MAAFPLIGVLIGALWAGVAWGSTRLWAPVVAAALVLMADLLVTGGLHLDAVADVADGLASRRPAEEALTIMRDPAIGAVGGAALVIALLLRFAFLTVLASRGWWAWLILPPVAGRAAMVWTMARARRTWSSSIAVSLTEVADPAVVVVAALIAAATGWATVGFAGVAAVVVAGASAEVWTRFFERRFEALTGDAVGASGIVSETGVLAVITAISR